jgi:hypothetical protein
MKLVRVGEENGQKAGDKDSMAGEMKGEAGSSVWQHRDHPEEDEQWYIETEGSIEHTYFSSPVVF